MKSVNCMVDGERGRNRTYNLLIKSQLLCQLSYAPTANGTVGTNFDYSIGLALFCSRLRQISAASHDTILISRATPARQTGRTSTPIPREQVRPRAT